MQSDRRFPRADSLRLKRRPREKGHFSILLANLLPLKAGLMRHAFSRISSSLVWGVAAAIEYYQFDSFSNNFSSNFSLLRRYSATSSSPRSPSRDASVVVVVVVRHARYNSLDIVFPRLCIFHSLDMCFPINMHSRRIHMGISPLPLHSTSSLYSFSIDHAACNRPDAKPRRSFACIYPICSVRP